MTILVVAQCGISFIAFYLFIAHRQNIINGFKMPRKREKKIYIMRNDSGNDDEQISGEKKNADKTWLKTFTVKNGASFLNSRNSTL